MFSMHPEMLLSLLFCEELDPHEAVLMEGCEHFSRGRGYSRTFAFDGAFNDSAPMFDIYYRSFPSFLIVLLLFIHRTFHSLNHNIVFMFLFLFFSFLSSI